MWQRYFLLYTRSASGALSLWALRDLTYIHHVPEHNDERYACTTLKKEGWAFMALSAYPSPRASFAKQRSNDILSNILPFNRLTGNFSAEYTSWRSTHINARGKALEKVSCRHNLRLLPDNYSAFIHNSPCRTLFGWSFLSYLLFLQSTWHFEMNAHERNLEAPFTTIFNYTLLIAYRQIY